MREMNYTVAAREGLREEMLRDPSVFVVGEGIGERGGNFNTRLMSDPVSRLARSLAGGWAPRLSAKRSPGGPGSIRIPPGGQGSGGAVP